MKRKGKNWLKLLPMAMLILLIFFSIYNCKTKLIPIPIGDSKVIQRLDNGNWEVTPAFILKFNELQSENNMLKLEVKKLRELLEKD